MLVSIEPDGPVPIYQQIRDRVVEAIAGGQLPAGSRFPEPYGPGRSCRGHTR